MNRIGSVIQLQLKTEDKKSIAASYYPSDNNNSTGLVLLHMLNSSRHSYDGFAESAQAMGFAVISLDFRGHGDSEGKWQNFNEEDFRNMELDAKAAYNYLKSKKTAGVYAIGASIGANTAINFAYHQTDILGAVALSPSKNYRGISTEEALVNFTKRLMIVTSSGDEKSYADSVWIYNAAKGDKHIEKFDNSYHGTNLLGTKLIESIIGWINK